MNILVIGGAGYIGSHMVKMLYQAGHRIVTLDNLSTGHRDAVGYGEFIKGDISDSNLLDQVLSAHRFDGVMHFASYIEVGESVKEPAKYYANNFTNTVNLLNAMVRNDVLRFIFSSTAAIFGKPNYVPINETHPNNPINPYGRSKWMVELVLEDYQRAYGLESVCLRYFNAAGADPEGELGERHEPESHLIPLVLQAASGRRDSISIFGRDYDTRDGSCVRDYIHVVDLCNAHLLALQALISGSGSKRYNLGNGSGFSVIEVIEQVKQVTGCSFDVLEADRRAGDPPTLIADASLAQDELNWAPKYNHLPIIIGHAWNWERQLFDNGGDRASGELKKS